MAAFLDNVKFNPTAGGTTDWTFSTAVTGYQSPALGGVVNGTTYKYFAVSPDLSQWEIGQGAYNTGTSVLPRTTVLYNSSGSGTATGQSGAGTKINFTNPPFVAIVSIKEDLISIEEANSFTTTQQGQARTNILAAATPANWTRTIKTSGSGTYTTPTGCKAIRVVGNGGGGGGAGSGTTPGAATAGTATTFGTSLLTANGGAAGTTGGGSAAGGTATGGDVNITGQNAGSSQGGTTHDGGYGGNAPFGLGFGGPGGPAGANQGSTGSGFGAGGGGAGDGGTANTGGGGAGAGGFDKLIASPLASYAYAVGAAGNAGTAGTGGAAGGASVGGILIIDEFY